VVVGAGAAHPHAALGKRQAMRGPAGA
jgi:hypothetical protein